MDDRSIDDEGTSKSAPDWVSDLPPLMLALLTVYRDAIRHDPVLARGHFRISEDLANLLARMDKECLTRFSDALVNACAVRIDESVALLHLAEMALAGTPKSELRIAALAHATTSKR